MKLLKVIPPHETATYLLVDCWHAVESGGGYVPMDPQEARELALELLLAAKECEERESDETD
jgi:hypothetical protein